jgi:hypothetical protein
MSRLTLFKKDHLTYIDNPGKGICGAYSWYQALGLFRHLNSDRSMFTRNGSNESYILEQISNSMATIKNRVESSREEFSRRSLATVLTWTDEVMYSVHFISWLD